MKTEIEQLIADYKDSLESSSTNDDFDEGWNTAMKTVIEDLKLILGQ